MTADTALTIERDIHRAVVDFRGISIGTDDVLARAFYVIVDESIAVSDADLNVVKTMQESLLATLLADPLTDSVHVRYITFSSSPRIVTALSALHEITSLPALQPGGRADYRRLFEDLFPMVAGDCEWLKLNAKSVFQPLALLITAGDPVLNGWQAAHQLLVQRRQGVFALGIFAYGTPGANPEVIGALGTLGAYIADQDASPATVHPQDPTTDHKGCGTSDLTSSDRSTQ